MVYAPLAGNYTVVVFNSTGNQIYLSDVLNIAVDTNDWITIDLFAESIPEITGDFYAGIDFQDAQTFYIGADNTTIQNRSYIDINYSGYPFFTWSSANWMIRATVEPAMIQVDVDIKPESSCNPLNVSEKGVIPVTILGTQDFDVIQIDPSTLMLDGVSSLRWSWEDVPEEDGYMDLSLKFKAQELVAALGPVGDGAEVVLTLTGNLKAEFGGTMISGEDVVLIMSK